jgi:hypothetical protein
MPVQTGKGKAVVSASPRRTRPHARPTASAPPPNLPGLRRNPMADRLTSRSVPDLAHAAPYLDHSRCAGRGAGSAHKFVQHLPGQRQHAVRGKDNML